MEFIQRHLLRGAAAGRDPRERALQAVVELGSRLSDPMQQQTLVHRAAQVLGNELGFALGRAERVIEHALALKRAGQSLQRPLEAAIRDRPEGHSEFRLLEVLLHHPESLAEVRDWVSPADFAEPVCAALADWLWAGGGGFPEDEEVAALARELAATESQNWEAEARGAAGRVRQRSLARTCTKKEQEWARAPAGPEAARLTQEIQQLRQEIRDLEALIRTPSR